MFLHLGIVRKPIGVPGSQQQTPSLFDLIKRSSGWDFQYSEVFLDFAIHSESPR